MRCQDNNLFISINDIAYVTWNSSKGNDLRILRGKRSREDLSKAIAAMGESCSHENLKKLEYGKSKSVSIDVLMAICDALEIPVNSFAEIS